MFTPGRKEAVPHTSCRPDSLEWWTISRPSSENIALMLLVPVSRNTVGGPGLPTRKRLGVDFETEESREKNVAPLQADQSCANTSLTGLGIPM
jgi:hypothetical protein